MTTKMNIKIMQVGLVKRYPNMATMICVGARKSEKERDQKFLIRSFAAH